VISSSKGVFFAGENAEIWMSLMYLSCFQEIWNPEPLYVFLPKKNSVMVAFKGIPSHCLMESPEFNVYIYIHIYLYVYIYIYMDIYGGFLK